MTYTGASPTSRPAVAAFSPNHGWPRSLSSPLPRGTSKREAVVAMARAVGLESRGCGSPPGAGGPGPTAEGPGVRWKLGSEGACAGKGGGREKRPSPCGVRVGLSHGELGAAGVGVIIASQMNAGWKHVP